MLLPPDAARLLGRYMRDAVLTAPAGASADIRRIAGRRHGGSSGAPSHSWFVGLPRTDRRPTAWRSRSSWRTLDMQRRAAPVAGEI